MKKEKKKTTTTTTTTRVGLFSSSPYNKLFDEDIVYFSPRANPPSFLFRFLCGCREANHWNRRMMLESLFFFSFFSTSLSLSLRAAFKELRCAPGSRKDMEEEKKPFSHFAPCRKRTGFRRLPTELLVLINKKEKKRNFKFCFFRKEGTKWEKRKYKSGEHKRALDFISYRLDCI